MSDKFKPGDVVFHKGENGAPRGPYTIIKKCTVDCHNGVPYWFVYSEKDNGELEFMESNLVGVGSTAAVTEFEVGDRVRIFGQELEVTDVWSGAYIFKNEKKEVMATVHKELIPNPAEYLIERECPTCRGSGKVQFND